jgi:hypothetical protein
MSRRSMVSVLAVFVVLSLATVTLAADPIIGTWKLNVVQSKFSPIVLAFLKGAARKERTENYRGIEKDQIELSSNTILADGSSRAARAIWPAQGGLVVEHDPPVEGVSYVETVIEPGDWYLTVLQNGKQAKVIHKTVSKDGKVMTQTTTGTDPEGKPYKQMEVYDRVILEDPQLGTWVLDVNKSTFNFGPVPRSETRVFTMAGENLKFTSDGVDASGRLWHSEYTAKLDGKDYPISGSQDVDSISLRRVDPFVLEVMMKKAGKVAITGTRVISKDGKTATVTNTRTDAKGSKVSNVQIFIKQ